MADYSSPSAMALIALMRLRGVGRGSALKYVEGFDAAARSENVRRVGELARLMVDAGLIVIVALISPFRADRARAAALFPEGRILEVFVDTPPELCRQRDIKGLYRKADSGKVANVTGRDQPYEVPDAPDLVLRTIEMDAERAAELLTRQVLARV